MSSIIANTNELKESRTWNETVVNELSQAANYLFDILNNTLDISKLEEGKIEFNNNYEPIHQFVDVILGLVKSNADKRKVTLEHSLSPIIPPFIEFDKSRVTQVILNILSNAIKFTPAEGKVKLSLSWIYDCGHNGGDCFTCNGCYNNNNKPSAPPAKKVERAAASTAFILPPVLFFREFSTEILAYKNKIAWATANTTHILQ